MPRASPEPPSEVISRTTVGAKIVPKIASVPRPIVTIISSVPLMRRNSSRRCGSAQSASTGTSAASSMPLTIRSKSRVLTLSATVKAAISLPAPKSPEVSCSRTSPRTRLPRLPAMIKNAAAAIPRWATRSVAGSVVTGGGFLPLPEAIPDDEEWQRGEQPIRNQLHMQHFFTAIVEI